MKSIVSTPFKSLTLTFLFLVSVLSISSQVTYTWNGTVSSEWNNGSNWTPVGPPLNTDHVIIVASPNDPGLSNDVTIEDFTINSGALNLAGFTITSEGNHSFSGGNILNGTFQSNTGVLTTFSSTTFDVNIDITSERILLNGCVFNNPVVLEQNGTTNASGTGNATFNAPLDFTLTGTAFFRTNGNNTFNDNVFLTNNGGNYLLLEFTTASVYNGDVFITNNSTSNVRMAYEGNSVFNGNIEFNNTSTGQIVFCERATSSATLGAGVQMSIGGIGFDSGFLIIRRMTQLGLTPQNLTVGTNARITLENNIFNAPSSFTSGRMFLLGNVFNNVVSLEKIGANNDNSTGGNIFNQTSTIVNSGSGRLLFANTSPDIFNDETTIISNGSSQIWMAHNSIGNQFNHNIIVESTGTSSGVEFGRGGTGDVTLADGFTVTVGAGGFSTGTLRFRNFTQVGLTPQNLTLTGTGYMLQQESNWGGDINFVAPRYYTRSTVYNGNSYLEKTGISDDDSPGNNIFHQDAIIVNSGDGRLRFATNDPDIFNGNTFVRNTGTSVIWMADNSSGNQFNGNIQVESVGSNGITFGRGGGGDATMAATYTVTVGPLGFDSGELIFNTFTQVGPTSQSLTLTGTGYCRNFESIWNGDVQFIAPRMYTRGTVYNGTAYLEKTGTTDDRSAGNNVFNDVATIVNSGIRYFGMGWTNPDIFNADVNLRNTGTSYIHMAYNSSGNQFNGNIQVESPSGQGIRFGQGNGDAILADGMQVSVGGLGFTDGELQFRNFTQIGNTPQNLTLTGSATLNNYDATWNGNVDFSSPRHYTRGTTYNNSAYLEKTGTGNDASVGGNTFNDETSIVNSGVGYFMPANGTGNDFNANVSFIQNNTGTIFPCYNSASTFAGDINIDYSNGQIYFGAVTNGRGILDGNTDQNINDLGTSSTPRFRDLEVNKTGGSVILNMPIQIELELDLVSQNIISDATNLVLMTDNSIVSNVSDASYVQGPVRKIGNDAFDFPVGKGGFYRPISISAPSNNTHHFTAEFFDSEADAVDMQDPATIDAAIENISDCEHWILNRTNGASNVNVTLSYRPYGANGCSGVADLSALTIARWDGAMWVNHPGTAVGNPSGSITTNATVTSFSPFALATTSNSNPLPIELVSFTAKANGNHVDLEWQTASEINNDFFTIERSKDGLEFEIVTTVKGAGNSTALLNYKTLDSNPYSGTSFYRLKQTDFDGAFEYSEVRRVEIVKEGTVLIYPNPVFESDERFIVDVSGFQNGVDEIIVHDALGKEVYRMSKSINGKVDLNLQSFDTGVYFVTINSNEKVIVKKVIYQ